MPSRSSPVAAPWGNRIVRSAMVPAGQFLANPRNWRIHPTFQQDQMVVMLQRVGFVAPVMVNLRTSEEWGEERNVETMVDGHLRVELALSRGEDTLVPTSFVDLTPVEERAVLLTLDPLGELAGTDKEKLPSLIEEVEVDFADTDLDLEALFKTETRTAKGLRHEVKECTCCNRKCSPRCGCYRETKPKRKKR